MLERAVRCIENARQHVYLGSKRTFRSRRTLHPKFWSCNTENSAISFLYFFIVQSTGGKRFTTNHNDATSFDMAFSSTPLEFLYPPKVRSFARTYTSEHKKGLSQGRRKRNISRLYSSSASNYLTQEPLDAGDPSTNDVGLEGTSNDIRTFLLNKGPRDYGAAWQLYKSNGSPEEVESELLSYLSESQDIRDFQRCQILFEKIHPSLRSERDYLSAVKIALNNKSRAYKSFALEICGEASRRGKTQCWHYAFMYLVNEMDWENTRHLWNTKPDRLPRSLQFPEAPQSKSLANCLSTLLDLTRQNKAKDVTEMTLYILRLVISHDKLMLEVSMQQLLGIFKDSIDLQLFNRRDFIQAINTLQSSEIRSANGRSIMVYRNFRWRMPEQIPPKALISGLLRMLSDIEVLEGVNYLLEEFRLHYGKPPKSAYHHALLVSAKLADTSTTLRFYNDYKTDYGIAVSSDILGPLLYVHARTGDVEKTQKWFDYVSKLGALPNVRYWNILIIAYSRNKDLEGALRIFQRMLKAGMVPNSVSFTILMGLSAGRGDTTAVLDLFDMAQRKKVRISRAMFDTLVEVLCKHRKFLDAERVAEQATTIFPAEDMTRAWNIILWNYAYTVDVSSISRIQSRMQELEIRFDGMTYAALMSSLVRIGKTESARKLLGVLHRNHEIHLTLLHYSLLLHGYVQEKNRDMAQVIYLEMMERFNTAGLSGTLAMLKHQIDRDVQQARETLGGANGERIVLPRAEKLLKSTTESLDTKDFGTKLPQPGSNGRSLREAIPAVFYERIIRAYGRNNCGEKIGDLFLEWSEKSRLTLPDRLPHSPIMLHALMVNYLTEDKHYEVKKCFEAALTHTVQRSRGVNMKKALSRPSEAPASRNGTVENPSFYNYTPTVLPSHRFDLSSCISTYMRSLSKQNLHSKIADLLTQMEKLGFAFSTRNWSLYLNILCLSRDPASQALAFTIFEEKFMPNYPGWRYIKRGYTMRPEGAPIEMDRLEGVFRRGKPGRMIGEKVRGLWAKVDPGYMQPTHLNILHLASALIDFRSRSIIDGGAEMNQLFSKAPKTYTAVATIPYLVDKFQTIISQFNAKQANKELTARAETPSDAAWTGGVLGEGQERINTSQVQRNLEEEEIEDAGADEPSSKAKRDPSTVFGRVEDFGSTEPESPLLESLLAEDMARRMSVEMPEQSDATPLAERTLSAEDEWDLEHYNRLSAHAETEFE
ncbi:hypothetical protein FQN49_005178 [Arthroderma sp. PD_2]|nr:hypothetical protein FQN49_005178 [Arthroderma sp. PD_2]